MAAVAARTPVSKRGRGSSDVNDGSYAPLYLTSSLGNVSFDMEELESLALSRLRLLKAADLARQSSGTTNKGMTEHIKLLIRQAEREHGLNVPEKAGPDREEAILKDEASHFLVRLALCKNADQRAWLLGREWDLFMTRLERSDVEFPLRVLEKAKGPQILRVGFEEMDGIRTQLEAAARSSGIGRGEGTYYKVAFEEIPSLVRGRRAFIKGGWAYVPLRNILEVVGAHFRTRFNQSLAIAAKGVGYAESDKRMRPILQSIRAHYAAETGGKREFDSVGNTGPESINLSGLNDSIPAMPLCMRNMMEKLKQDHHLRYAGRLILGAFLKGCGLTMDESLRFWQTEFGKGHITAEKFQKEYAYNIRHQYGKEGKRRNLTPYSCMKVINDRPGPGEHHGCPYREFPENRLKASLRRMGADPGAVNAIALKAKESGFQIACGMCFRATQPPPVEREEEAEEFVPNHPNEYFIEARRRQMKIMQGGTQTEQGAMEIDSVQESEKLDQNDTTQNQKVEESVEENEPMQVDSTTGENTTNAPKDVDQDEQRPADQQGEQAFKQDEIQPAEPSTNDDEIQPAQK